MRPSPPTTPSRPRPAPAGFARPLVGMDVVKSFLGLNEDQARAEIAAGRLKWAFDLHATGEKQFPRVLSVSLAGWNRPEIIQPDSLEAVADLLLPPGDILATDLQGIFNVSSEHLLNLIRARKLKVVPDPETRLRWRPGPGGSALMKRDSIVKFLRTAQARLLDNLSYNTGAVRPLRKWEFQYKPNKRKRTFNSQHSTFNTQVPSKGAKSIFQPETHIHLQE